LWHKFDTNVQQYLTDADVVIELIQACFEQAGYKADYEQFKSQLNLKEVVDYHFAQTQDNQIFIENLDEIIDDLYNFKSHLKEQPTLPAASTSAVAESPTKIIRGIDYEDYYRRIKFMAKDMGWSQNQITEALRDREFGERKYMVWFNSKEQNYKMTPTAPVIQRLIEDASGREEEKQKREQERAQKEEEDAQKLANTYRPKGEVRSRKQFYEEQIQFKLRI
jgi:hypothetical protein